MRIKPRRGSWILAVLLGIVVSFPQVKANASQNGEVIFGYQQGIISQQNNINLSEKTLVSYEVKARETQDWKPSDDPLGIELSFYDASNSLLGISSSTNTTLSSSTYQFFTGSENPSSLQFWNDVNSIKISVTGGDGEFWAGNYGTALDSVKLFVDGIQILSNSEFNDNNTGWTSDIGWQACSGGSGGSPCINITNPITSLEVTSLADTVDSGTLRWAITQANTISGGIYDSITFANNLSGTISLTSALPTISQNLTITGPGQNILTIDGMGSYRLFTVNAAISLSLSSLTLKSGQNTNGGIIYNNKGAVAASNIRFTTMAGGSAVFNNNGGAVAAYTDCTFDNLSIGIAGDYGSTPSLPANTASWEGYADSGFQNRTYVNRGTFNNNWAGIYNYRFTKIENSTFSNNSYGANVTGLNRTQIYNSTFNTNSIAVYHNAWIPTTFNMGTDNRLIIGNNFINNGISIYLDDGYNNGNKYQGWSSVSNNTWDENGTWIQYYYWDGSKNVGATATPYSTGTQFTQSSNTVPTTTTTVPETTTTEPEVIPPPVETIPTENTTVSIPELDPNPISIPETENTTVITPELDLTPVSTPEIDTTPVTIAEPEDLPNEIIPEVSIPEQTQNTADQTVTDIFENTDNVDELSTAVTDVVGNAESPEEIAALITSLFDGPMNNEEFTTVINSVFTEDLSTEELSAALDAVFAEPLSDEKFAEVINAVLDSPLTDEQFAEVVDILQSENISEDQVADAVDTILGNGVTEDQATELASSNKVLESIDGEQAAEIFDEILVGELTTEEEANLVAAVTGAPEEVKNAFEETINVYAEGLDDYIAVGSNVDVGSRRTLLAASAALAAATVGVAGTGGGPGGSGGGSGGSGGGPGGNSNGRKEEENPDGDEEEDVEIEGPEDQEDNHFTKNSIFKYEEETMKKRFSPWGFIKKLGKETSALAFTISGSVVVFATLSGETRTITIIATSCAFLVHYTYAMIKNDE